MPAQVVVVGSFNVDHVWACDTLPAAGQTLSGAYRTGPGGKGFNQAIAARRAGADTLFVCALGEDTGAALARTLSQADGLGLEASPSDEATGTAGIYVDARGGNCIVIGAGANATLDAAFIAAHATAIASAAVVLAQMETPPGAVGEALRLGRAGGATTLLNPAPANEQVDGALLALADVLTPNETEFAALLSAHAGESLDAESIAGTDEDRLHALCRALLPSGSVVITLGSAGSFVSHPADARRGDAAERYRVPAAPAQPIDTTGAGDAFNGALAASLAARPAAAFRAHIAFASRYAARSTEAEGAALAMPRMTPG